MIQEEMFHCDHCSGIFDINKIEIRAVDTSDGEIIVCEGCYLQLRGGNE